MFRTRTAVPPALPAPAPGPAAGPATPVAAPASTVAISTAPANTAPASTVPASTVPGRLGRPAAPSTRAASGRRTAWLAGIAAGACAVAALTAGCSSSPAKAPHGTAAVPAAKQLAPPRAVCGTSHTAANVPVTMEVEKGSVSCPVAMRVQNSYTTLIQSGKVAGNGGGAPVQVDGWTCQGTDTTTTVQTGEASECRRSGTEIVAVLKLQSSSSSSPSPSG